ncbi:phosphoadenylyl-sulfate reductase [Caulobacter sp. S45]|uniref:phosphoadenylyl-sulfate reductase n=1 Tax=Caulobacter sp. S45 TaxID=1641861 RepID=UPI001576F1DD|nr:phosphoadenylyl-sulfate reductase [Caulobacter sp. S45]
MDLLPDIHFEHRETSADGHAPTDAAYAYRHLQALERAGADGRELLGHALRDLLPGRIAAVSSFGAESAVLLSVIAAIDPSTPVVFLETGKHFPETLAYRQELAEHLGLLDVRDVAPPPAAVADRDPTGELWHFDPDACCALRKVQPLETALAPFQGWISGRKRFQASTRAALPFVELDRGRIKLNPIADWDGARMRAERTLRRLPPHPLVERGYASIGCSVCTRSVGAGEDARAGRWSGSGKVECGIHRQGQGSALDPLKAEP